MRDSVAIIKCPTSADEPYPPFPYDPPQAYPEFPDIRVGKSNPLYHAVRHSFYLLGLDRNNYSTSRWNPLGEFIQPGCNVLIKPNWVKHCHAAGGDLFSVITHTSIIRPVIDYVLLALKGKGRLIIADAPLQSADFDLLMKYTRIPELMEYLSPSGVCLEVRDLRKNVCRCDSNGHVISHEQRLGDPDGYVVAKLFGPASFLSEVGQYAGRFRVTQYDPCTMNLHHAGDRHEYLIAKTVLNSDVVINLPKLKTHRKAGLTCCLKNLVGINGSKDYLPHHRLGALAENGDEYLYPNFFKRLHSRIIDYIEARPSGSFNHLAYFMVRASCWLANRLARDPYYEGSWYGNDTIWRTILDLNRILRYARSDGSFAVTPQREIFNIVDAVVVGGGEGPLQPTPVLAGMILAGCSSPYIDAYAARLIGLDPRKIPLLCHALDSLADGLKDDITARLVSEDMDVYNLSLADTQPFTRVAAPAHWYGHVELNTV